MITGSLCLTEIIELANNKHSAFTKAQNGKIYFNILVWENDEPDKFNNNFSVQLNAAKDAPEDQKKKYIGNLKYVATNAQPVQGSDLPAPGTLEAAFDTKPAPVDDTPF